MICIPSTGIAAISLRTTGRSKFFAANSTFHKITMFLSRQYYEYLYVYRTQQNPSIPKRTVHTYTVLFYIYLKQTARYPESAFLPVYPYYIDTYKNTPPPVYCCRIVAFLLYLIIIPSDCANWTGYMYFTSFYVYSDSDIDIDIFSILI